jgi:poly(3-hydroxybutyrate) depolymerase
VDAESRHHRAYLAWGPMLYQAFQAQADIMAPLRFWGELYATALRSNPSLMRLPGVSHVAAGFEMIERAGLSHARPAFAMAPVTVGNRECEIVEEHTFATPFAKLLRFKKDIDTPQPRVLIVAPLSGHFPTLLRSTVEAMLPEHDVYITDWTNARDVPMSAGRFGFDEYVETVISFLNAMGPGAHLLGVCQPCAHALAAVALMAEENHPATPRSLTLMAGPVDTRINPSKVNELATSNPIEWFANNLIATVPYRYAGAGRRVYPGFMQLTAFMNMNVERHMNAHIDMFTDLATGNHEKAETNKTFYDEYFAVLDLTEEFYLETVERVFQEHLLPKGELVVSGRKVDCSAIRKTALLTVEGERDDICSIGQTVAAQGLCSRIRPHMKRHHLQAGVGHYGVFSGRKWKGQIYPLVRNMILASE